CRFHGAPRERPGGTADAARDRGAERGRRRADQQAHRAATEYFASYREIPRRGAVPETRRAHARRGRRKGRAAPRRDDRALSASTPSEATPGFGRRNIGGMTSADSPARLFT